LGQLIDRLSNMEEKKKLFLEFKAVNLKIGDVSGKGFDESDEFYLELIDDLQITQGVVHLFIENHTNLSDLLTRLENILKKIDQILYPQTLPAGYKGPEKTGVKEIQEIQG
jgi:hypothetical protein